jgi:hypothetical protein
MPEQIPSYFHTNISFFALLAAGILSGLFAFYQYKRTIPPIPPWLQIFLGITRGMAIAGIFLLLFAPEITAIWKIKESGQLIIAVDKSASMGIQENNQDRLTRALGVVENFLDFSEDQISTAIYAFDTDTMRTLNLDIDTTRFGTDIENAITAISNKERTATNMILLTDGNFTVGQNPLYSDFINRLKIYTIGFGDTLNLPDLLITDVKYNKIVYQNQPTEMQVHIMSPGIKDQQVTLSLKQNNQVIKARKIDIRSEQGITVATIDVIPEKTGLTQYQLEIQSLPVEAIRENNAYSVAMEVLKGKIHVGLLSGKADHESKFLGSVLGDLEDIEINTSVFKKNRQYFLNTPDKILDSLDVLVLCNYSSDRLNDQRTENILQKISVQRKPALILMGEPVTGAQLQTLKDFFPIRSLRQSDMTVETQVKPKIEGQLLSLLSIFDHSESELKFWNLAPPIQYNYTDVKFQEPVKILLETQNPSNIKKSGLPVLSVYEDKGKKSILLLGAGFWRWHFMLAEDRAYRNSWQLILKNMIRWLDSGTTDNNVIVTSDKKTYQEGENIILTTQVYDGSFHPLDNALVRTKVSGPSAAFEFESEFVQKGRYEGSFLPIKSGKYNIHAEAWKNDIKLGEHKAELMVMPVNREFLKTKQAVNFLKKLAEKSGGTYFNENEAEKIKDILDFRPEIKTESATIELWNRLPVLLIIIFLLSLEWFIRKRKGLA